MEITEVRVKLVNVKNDKLRAFCSITVDNDFVVRDLKVIEGAKGAFVAMPSRKLTERCPRCSGKNHYRARFCNDCGARLGDRGGRGDQGGPKLHTDIAHPINSRCREVIQKKVLEVYQEEVQKSAEPGYKPMEFEVFDEESLVEEASREMVGPAAGTDGGETPLGERRLRVHGERPGGQNGGNGHDRGPADRPAADRAPADRGQGDRGPQDRGRGRFRRGFRGPREDREGGRDNRGPNGGGRGGEPLIAERARESFPPSPREAPAASAPPPAREGVREEPESEPEDNFGAGLFS